MKPVISSTCQVNYGALSCGIPTAFGYEAMGGGWMALCAAHAEKYHPNVLPIAEIVARDGRHRTADEYAEFRAKRKAEATP